ncbi:MAG: DnaJ domain-containing protein [Chloroflexi bacterium]|nr:DnaJ domain-containing protein [Chloroflexota bacterium]
MVSVYYHWPDAADGEGAWRFGPPSDLTDFQCHTVELNRIRWKVAALGTQQFWDPAAQERERQRQQQGNRHTNRTRRPRRQHQRAAQVYYDILGVRREASEVEVKQAYRALAQAFHPDRNTSPQASEHMKRINEAYRQIMKK